MKEILGRAATSAINNSRWYSHFAITLTIDFNTINLQAFFYSLNPHSLPFHFLYNYSISLALSDDDSYKLGELLSGRG